MTDAAIAFQTGEPVAIVTLTAPERRNALTRTDIAALAAGLSGLAEDGRTRAVILTGTGPVFSAGVSLGDVAGGDWEENPLVDLCATIERLPQPVVCAMNGGVYGGAAEIALACDFRIGVREMALLIPPARLGIHYEPSGLHRAVACLGLQAARRLFLMTEKVEGGEALQALGFLDRVVPDADALQVEAYAMAQRIAGLAPLALAGMKRTLNEIARGALDQEAAAQRVADCWASADLKEGLAAHHEKRAPRFKGR